MTVTLLATGHATVARAARIENLKSSLTPAEWAEVKQITLTTPNNIEAAVQIVRRRAGMG